MVYKVKTQRFQCLSTRFIGTCVEAINRIGKDKLNWLSIRLSGSFRGSDKQNRLSARLGGPCGDSDKLNWLIIRLGVSCGYSDKPN